MKKQLIKDIVSVAAVLLAFALVLGLATALLRPKYMTDLEEGSFIAQFAGPAFFALHLLLSEISYRLS